jgi:hypothetical protein
MNESITPYQNLKSIITTIFSSLKLPNREHPKGRMPALTNVEAVTCAVIKQQQNIETKKSLYEMIEPSCSYNTFVVSINRTLVYLAQIIATVISVFRKEAHLIKFTDATETPVCLLKNAKHHKTMAEFSTKSKSSKGYYFGLKTHLTADLEDRVLGLAFSTATGNDRDIFSKINSTLSGIFVADAGYVGEKFSRDFYIEGRRMVLTATRINMTKVSTPLQVELLNLRMNIETNFRMLKVVYGFITSMPRSVIGYFTHYLAAISAHVLHLLFTIPRKVAPLVLA